MIKQFISILATLALSLSLSSISWAAPLSDQHVKGFIDSMPEAMKIGEQYEHDTQQNIDPSRPLSSGLEQLDPKDPGYNDLTQLAQRHGFSNLKQWAEVGDRVMNAYIYAFSGATMNALQATFNTALADIPNNPAIPADQKAALIASMQGMNVSTSTEPDTAVQDLPAIQPYMSELNKLFD